MWTKKPDLSADSIIYQFPDKTLGRNWLWTSRPLVTKDTQYFQIGLKSKEQSQMFKEYFDTFISTQLTLLSRLN
jgi:hypothetical protein